MRALYVIAAGAAVGALLLTFRDAGASGRAIGGAAIDLADGVITGAVVGIGEAVGVPPTNETECERAKREGRTWDASFACPAGNFLKYLFS